MAQEDTGPPRKQIWPRITNIKNEKQICPRIRNIKNEAEMSCEDITRKIKQLKGLSVAKIIKKHDRTVLKSKAQKPKMNDMSSVKQDKYDSALRRWQVSIREILASSNATPFSNHIGAGYKCCFCVKHFPNPADLKRHNIELHVKDINRFKKKECTWQFFVKLDITKLHCNLCKQETATVEQLINHLNDEHNKKVLADIKKLIFPFKFDDDELRCSDCSEPFHTFKLLQEHMHSHYMNFVCDICSAGFITKSFLNTHKKTHTGKTQSDTANDTKHELIVEGKKNIDTDIIDLSLVHWHTDVREILANSNATAIGRHTGLSFICAFCCKQFPNPADLKQHNIQMHTKDIRNFRRGEPPKRFYAKLDITDLHCKICEQETATIGQLIEHLNNMHNKNVRNDVKKLIFPFKFHGDDLRCCECSQYFHTFKSLQSHMHSHFKNFICKICAAGFITKSALQIHWNTHKTGSFKCSYCVKTFDTLNFAKYHEQYVHVTGTLRNLCRICNKRFKDYRDKKKHLIRVHGVGGLDYKCQSCDKAFGSSRALAGHTKSYHLMLRPHKCPECDMSFYAKAELQNHMLKHTGKKEFQCDVCLKKFGRRFTLIEHLRIHFDDRRFKCEICGQAFVQKCSLKGHMRSKHGALI